MAKRILTIFILFFLVRGFSQTTTTGSFIYDGQLRTYRLYVPAIYDGTKPVPLVFNLHGYSSSAEQQEFYGDFRQVADTANFIIVHPQGLLDDFGATHWNTFETSEIDDVGFLSALLDTVYTNYNIYGNQIYSVGMSNGGFMSYKLACLLSGRIAAVASVTGSMTFVEEEGCITNHPMPVMQIHGTADGTVPYDGNMFFMPVEDVVDYWADYNLCDTEPIVTEVPDTDPSDGSTATHYVYPNGVIGSSVEFYRVNGGEHTWPGADFEIGVTNQDFDASAEIWRFFRKYSLDVLTSSVDEITPTDLSFSVTPNPSENGLITLQFENSTTREISVTTLMGQTVYQNKTSSTTLELNLDTKGIYLVNVTENGKHAVQKVVRN